MYGVLGTYQLAEQLMCPPHEAFLLAIHLVFFCTAPSLLNARHLLDNLSGSQGENSFFSFPAIHWFCPLDLVINPC